MMRAIGLLMLAAAVLPAWTARDVSFLTGEHMQDSREALVSLLPAEVAGWKAEGEDQVFDPETIFDYIDGAGEVYRSYNFRLLLSRRYRRDGAADLVADLFDMGSSRDAFGVFTHDLEGEDAGVGQGSTYKGGLLSFWRDRYFVSLYAEEESEETKKALFSLGENIAAAVGRDGRLPDLLELVPPDYRATRSVRYFHTHHILNYHFFVATENVLELGSDTEAVLAVRPRPGEAAAPVRAEKGDGVLLIVEYPDGTGASASFSRFLEALMPDAAPKEGAPSSLRLVRTEDGRWAGAVLAGNVVAVVFQEPSEDGALAVLRFISKGDSHE